MKYLTLKDIELIHMQIIDASGGSQGVRDRERIRSAIAGTKQIVFGQELYVTVFEKAAVLMRGIIADHPFVDGNKRTGTISALVFLNFNNYDTSSLIDKELEDFAVKVAVEKLDVPQIAEWLKAKSRKSP
jgi:death on curing protein